MISSFWQDLRFAWRMLIKSPGYTCIAVAVLALGIGANTAVFSVIDAVLLRPLSYPQPDRLMVVRERMTASDSSSVAYPNYLDWRATQHSFDDISLLRRNSFSVSFPAASDLPPERVKAAETTANFLTVFGFNPELGRSFKDAEDTPGGPPVVMLSDEFWRRRFGASHTTLGQSIVVDGIAREIVGVVPPDVRFPRDVSVFVPLGDLRKDPAITNRGNHPGFSVMGRLKPGVTPAQAERDMNVIAAELERRYPENNTGRRVRVQSLLDFAVGSYSGSLYLLLGAVGCVLLIACANVANLQLARASARRKELAVRAALGAQRGRLMRQMLTESAVLGLLGGALALLLALWAMDAIIALSPANVPRFKETHLDLPALGFTTLVALGTGLLVGVWPAWRISGLAAMAATLHESSARGGSGGVAQQRARASLVVAQVALAMVLLACAGLTLKSFWRAQAEPLGFQRDGMLMMSISLPTSKYSDEKIAPFYTQLLERLHALPGVTGAAFGNNIPFEGTEWDSDYHLTGTPPALPGKEPLAQINFVSVEYFKTMGIPLLQGRDFDAQELPARPHTVIIDEAFARANFPGQDPIGKHIDDTQVADKNAPPLTVVGVVGRVAHDAPGSEPTVALMGQMYFSAIQYNTNEVALLIRVASGDPLRLAEPVRQVVLGIDPELPVADINTMNANIADSLAPRRLTMVLLGTFAVLALVLASIGLYGVMALSVTQRTRELGIRMTLGAQRATVLWLVLGQSARLVGIGLAAGLAAALGAGRIFASVVYGANAVDVFVLAWVALLLGGVGLLASYLPARRATRINPLAALREE